MGRDSDFLVGLDLGTKKITVAAAQVDEEDARIVAVGQAPARGLRKGKIVALGQAAGAVAEAVADAEAALGGPEITHAVVAYSCPEAGCYHAKGAISLGGAAPRQIMREDLERAIETALGALRLPPKTAVLHTLPVQYAVDGTGGIENPLDMTGSTLEVELTALTVPIPITQNVVNCVQRAGVTVTGLILKPVAEALGALTPDQRAAGAALIAVGGGTTGFAVFSEGRLMHASELAIGGDHISNDISCVLKIPFAAAESLKKALSVAPDESPDGVETLEFRGQKQDINRADVVDVEVSRLDELFADNIVPGIRALERKGVAVEVVMTGGVMLTPGIKALAESYLGGGVHIAAPVLGGEMPEGRNDCRYCAAAGIIVYLTERRKNPFAYVEPPVSIFKGYTISKTTTTVKPVKRPSVMDTFSRHVRDLIKELF